MFKKALKVATAFGVLVAAYALYVQVFAIVAALLGPARSHKGLLRDTYESKTKREAIARAVQTLGRGHWAAAEDLPVRYYNHERGYWMYAKDYERLNDGRRLRFKPFALIWRSGDGKGTKLTTSDEAVLDLDQPLGVVANKPGAPSQLHVIRARLEGNVRIRDDKGTPGDPRDDLFIGPLSYVEYDEASLQIRSESDVQIQDRDMRITGTGLVILMRPREAAALAPPGSAPGFNGAQAAFLKVNIHVIIKDVGRSGILPGMAQADPGRSGTTPIDLRCQGPMQVDLPKPRLPVRVGPPAPALPTVAQFTRDVRVLRGKFHESPDQLNCDHLRLILLPTEKEPVTATVQAAASDPATDLGLRRAEATGHAVWLQSPGQGMKARGNELIYEKRLPKAPDKTYFRADQSTKLWLEKVEVAQDGPNKGKVQSVTTVRAIDATSFDNGQGKGNASSTIIARGPGLLEVRPARDQPVQRSAQWRDELELRDEEGPDRQPRKRITLTGPSRYNDPAQATLDARQKIVVWLKPKAAPTSAPAAAASPAPVPLPDANNGAFQIERLLALDDVHLVAPGRTMYARDRLVAEFELPPSTDIAPPPAAPPAPAVATTGSTVPAPAQTQPTAAAPATAAKPPAQPNIDVKAERIWAQILQRPGQGAGSATADQKGEVQEVRLRGSVVFHQDPAPDKKRGTDVSGEALDFLNLGDGLAKLKVFHHDPTAGKPHPAWLERQDQDRSAHAPLARVATEDFTIEGSVIGLDQKTDQAWVDGRGSLTQLADRNLLSDKGLGDRSAAKVRPAAASKPTSMKISWKTEMKFFGQSTNPENQPSAKAEFFGGVRAEMEDGLLVCQEMRTYMDRTVKLARPKRDPKEISGENPADPAEPQPQIALIDCYRQVVAISRKVDPETRLLQQQQRIEGERVIYDKLTGNFQVPGAGKVFLYNREGQDEPNPALGGNRPIVPAANPARAVPVIGRNAGRPLDANPSALKGVVAKNPFAPLVLTQIRFAKAMRGRFGSGKDADKIDSRWADFFGDVEAIHAKVNNERTVLDPDSPPADALFLTSQILRVVSEPPPTGSADPSRNFLKAWDNAYATTNDTTIQADRITYDSLKELFYAYGNDGRDVVIAQQKNPGQPSSVIRGVTAIYNRKTGESQLVSPNSIQLIDVKTGQRPGPAAAPVPLKPKKPPRVPLRQTPNSSLERRGFNGR